MRIWLICLILAAPVCAQDAAEGAPGDDKEPIDPWEDFQVGAETDDAYLPLRLGRDRTGIGLRVRGSIGVDTNVYRVDRDEEAAAFLDGMAMFHAGANFGYTAFGVRGHVAGRLHFGEEDANLWDLKLGGFGKVPYGDGGLGFGLSADVLYQQLHTYDVTGPLVRQDDLRAAGYIARAHVGYRVSFLTFEGGLTGQINDYSEEQDIPSLDNWKLGIDLGVYLDIEGILRIHPYVLFDYAWFRDQLDLQDDGTLLNDEDKLQLSNFGYGADVELDVGFLRAQVTGYGQRQDDGAAGFDRYTQFGLRAAVDFMLIGFVRLSGGTHLWTREYDDRIEFDDGEPTTLIERNVDVWTELSWNFWQFFRLGARYEYARRISGIDNGGYVAHEFMGFLEIGF